MKAVLAIIGTACAVAAICATAAAVIVRAFEVAGTGDESKALACIALALASVSVFAWRAVLSMP